MPASARWFVASLLGAFGAGAAFALSAPLAAQDAPPPHLVAAGERLVTVSCAACHAVTRTGASAVAEAPPLRELRARYPLDHLAEALAEGITTGHADMPEFVFSTDEIEAILAYLEVISDPPGRR